MNAFRTVIKLLWFYAGLLVCTLGYALVIRPGLGVAPWDVFHLGVVGRTGLSLSFVLQATGAVVIGLNWLMGIRPSLGMVLNMLSFGPILQAVLPFVPTPDVLSARWTMLLAGILVTGIGVALYTSADLGTGPRDGMMVGLTRRLGVPVAVIKNGMDVTIAALGWLLGGPLGIGTVVVALGTGPAVQLGLRFVTWLAGVRPFDSFVRPLAFKQS